MLFRRLKALFFLIHTLSSANFSKLKNSQIFAKKSIQEEKTHFSKITFFTNTTAKLVPLMILERQSSLYVKKPKFPPPPKKKKNITSYVFGNFTIAVAFYGKFATTW